PHTPSFPKEFLMLTPHASRRDWLKATSCGFGYMALAGLTSQQTQASGSSPTTVRVPHFAPRAKRIIFMCMRGGPTHVDTFDYKPALARDHGKTVAIDRQGNVTPGGGNRKLTQSNWRFPHAGRSGLPISEL